MDDPQREQDESTNYALQLWKNIQDLIERNTAPLIERIEALEDRLARLESEQRP